MTFYIRFIPFAIENLISDGTLLLIIGDANFNTPTIFIRVLGSNYRIRFQNGTADVNSTLATTPPNHQLIELRAVLDDTGAVQIHESQNGAAEVSASKSAGIAIPPAWTKGAILFINSRGTEGVGFNAIREINIHRGVQTLGTMRRLAGVI